jgi:hypothetical protein
MSASRRLCCGITERILLAELWESRVGSCEFVKPKQIVTLLTFRNRCFEIYYYKYNKFVFNASGFITDAVLHRYYSLLNMFLKCYLNRDHLHKYHHLLQSRLLTVSPFGSPSEVNITSFNHRIRPDPRLLKHFRNKLSFYDEELLVSRLTPKLDDHPLSAVRDSLFSIFAATLHTWRASPPSATWGRGMPLWQGTHLHGRPFKWVKYCFIVTLQRKRDVYACNSSVWESRLKLRCFLFLLTDSLFKCRPEYRLLWYFRDIPQFLHDNRLKLEQDGFLTYHFQILLHHHPLIRCYKVVVTNSEVLFFSFEHGSNTLLRNVGYLLVHCTALYIRRYDSSVLTAPLNKTQIAKINHRTCKCDFIRTVTFEVKAHRTYSPFTKT